MKAKTNKQLTACAGVSVRTLLNWRKHYRKEDASGVQKKSVCEGSNMLKGIRNGISISDGSETGETENRHFDR